MTRRTLNRAIKRRAFEVFVISIGVSLLAQWAMPEGAWDEALWHATLANLMIASAVGGTIACYHMIKVIIRG